MRIKTNIKKHRLYWKLLLSFSSLAILMILVFYFVSSNLYSGEIKKRTLAYNQVIMENSGNQLDQVIYNLDRLSATFLTSDMQPLVRQLKSSSIHEEIQAVMNIQRTLESQIKYLALEDWVDLAIVVDTSGHIIYESKGTMRNNFFFPELEWFSSFVDSKKYSAIIPSHSRPYITTYPAKKESEHTTFSFIRRITDVYNPDQTLAYLIIDFPLEKVTKYLDTFRMVDDADVALLDSSGTSLYASSSSFKERYKDSKIMEKQGYQTNSLNYSRGKSVWFVQYLTTPGWYIISENPTSLATRDSKTVTWTVLCILFIILITFIIFSGLIAYQIVKPVNSLKQAMLLVKQGDLSTNVKISSSDEIGELGAIFNDMTLRLYSLVEEVYTVRIQEQEARLNALEAQINPHFLYNTLENIRSIANIEGIEPIEEISVALSSMFRYSIQMESGKTSLNNELQHIGHYLSIIQIRFFDSLTVTYELRDEYLHLTVMKLMLQPLVENAVIHGFCNNPRGKNLWISCQLSNDSFKVSIRDDGVGISSEKLSALRESLDHAASDNQALGIRNVHKRLRLLFGSDYGLTIESRLGEGTNVTVTLPLAEPDKKT